MPIFLTVLYALIVLLLVLTMVLRAVGCWHSLRIYRGITARQPVDISARNLPLRAEY